MVAPPVVGIVVPGADDTPQGVAKPAKEPGEILTDTI
jgi:hypothetical protein